MLSVPYGITKDHAIRSRCTASPGKAALLRYASNERDQKVGTNADTEQRDRELTTCNTPPAWGAYRSVFIGCGQGKPFYGYPMNVAIHDVAQFPRQ